MSCPAFSSSLWGSLQKTEVFAADVLEMLETWLAEAAPRTGTTLETTLLSVARHGAITSGPRLVSSGANKSNVHRAIDELEALGIVVETMGRKKDQLWVSPRLVEIVENAVGRGA